MDRDEARDGFCGKTFDEWLDSLSEEEISAIGSHSLEMVKFNDGGKVLVWWTDEGKARFYQANITEQSRRFLEDISIMSVSVFKTDAIEIFNEMHRKFEECLKEGLTEFRERVMDIKKEFDAHDSQDA